MRDLVLFAEDDGHEKFLAPLIRRLAADAGVDIRLRTLTSTGGHGQVLKKLKAYSKDLQSFATPLPDLVVVASDSNCTGFHDRRRYLKEAAESILHLVVWAVPDPHIERWLLLDPASFEAVVGARCLIPDQSATEIATSTCCAAVIASGVTPLLGGLEYAEELASCIDIGDASSRDHSFAEFVAEIKTGLRR